MPERRADTWGFWSGDWQICENPVHGDFGVGDNPKQDLTCPDCGGVGSHPAGGRAAPCTNPKFYNPQGDPRYSEGEFGEHYKDGVPCSNCNGEGFVAYVNDERTAAVSGPKVSFVQGDITKQNTDAIVNAANSELRTGGGVCGAIHAAGGPQIAHECQQIRKTTHPDGVAPGGAVVTSGGDLPAKWVIHAVGPMYDPRKDQSDVLRSAYQESLKRADEVGAKSVAFPAISTGIYGYPLEDAVRTAVDAVRDSDTKVEDVRFISFDDTTHGEFTKHAGRSEGKCSICGNPVPGWEEPEDPNQKFHDLCVPCGNLSDNLYVKDMMPHPEHGGLFNPLDEGIRRRGDDPRGSEGWIREPDYDYSEKLDKRVRELRKKTGHEFGDPRYPLWWPPHKDVDARNLTNEMRQENVQWAVDHMAQKHGYDPDYHKWPEVIEGIKNDSPSMAEGYAALQYMVEHKEGGPKEGHRVDLRNDDPRIRGEGVPVPSYDEMVRHMDDEHWTRGRANQYSERGLSVVYRNNHDRNPLLCPDCGRDITDARGAYAGTRHCVDHGWIDYWPDMPKDVKRGNMEWGEERLEFDVRRQFGKQGSSVEIGTQPCPVCFNQRSPSKGCWCGGTGIAIECKRCDGFGSFKNPNLDPRLPGDDDNTDCPDCDGYGIFPGNRKQGHVGDDGLKHHFPDVMDCPRCKGTGESQEHANRDRPGEKCRACEGLGVVLPCDYCGGSSRIPHVPGRGGGDSYYSDGHEFIRKERAKDDPRGGNVTKIRNPTWPDACCGCPKCDWAGVIPVTKVRSDIHNDPGWAAYHFTPNDIFGDESNLRTTPDGMKTFKTDLWQRKSHIGRDRAAHHGLQDCPLCKGTGLEHDPNQKKDEDECLLCLGLGIVRECPDCRGTAVRNKRGDPCTGCLGNTYHLEGDPRYKEDDSVSTKSYGVTRLVDWGTRKDVTLRRSLRPHIGHVGEWERKESAKKPPRTKWWKSPDDDELLEGRVNSRFLRRHIKDHHGEPYWWDLNEFFSNNPDNSDYEDLLDSHYEDHAYDQDELDHTHRIPPRRYDDPRGTGKKGHVGEDAATHHSNPDALREEHPYFDECPDCSGIGLDINNKSCSNCAGLGQAWDMEYWDGPDAGFIEDFANYPNIQQIKPDTKFLEEHVKGQHKVNEYDNPYVAHQNSHGVGRVIDDDLAKAIFMEPKKTAATDLGQCEERKTTGEPDLSAMDYAYDQSGQLVQCDRPATVQVNKHYKMCDLHAKWNAHLNGLAWSCTSCGHDITRPEADAVTGQKCANCKHDGGDHCTNCGVCVEENTDDPRSDTESRDAWADDDWKAPDQYYCGCPGFKSSGPKKTAQVGEDDPRFGQCSWPGDEGTGRCTRGARWRIVHKRRPQFDYSYCDKHVKVYQQPGDERYWNITKTANAGDLEPEMQALSDHRKSCQQCSGSINDLCEEGEKLEQAAQEATARKFLGGAYDGSIGPKKAAEFLAGKKARKLYDHLIEIPTEWNDSDGHFIEEDELLDHILKAPDKQSIEEVLDKFHQESHGTYDEELGPWHSHRPFQPGAYDDPRRASKTFEDDPRGDDYNHLGPLVLSHLKKQHLHNDHPGSYMDWMEQARDRNVDYNFWKDVVDGHASDHKYSAPGDWDDNHFHSVLPGKTGAAPAEFVPSGGYWDDWQALWDHMSQNHNLRRTDLDLNHMELGHDMQHDNANKGKISPVMKLHEHQTQKVGQIQPPPKRRKPDDPRGPIGKWNYSCPACGQNSVNFVQKGNWLSVCLDCGRKASISDRPCDHCGSLKITSVSLGEHIGKCRRRSCGYIFPLSGGDEVACSPIGGTRANIEGDPRYETWVPLEDFNSFRIHRIGAKFDYSVDRCIAYLAGKEVRPGDPRFKDDDSQRCMAPATVWGRMSGSETWYPACDRHEYKLDASWRDSDLEKTRTKPDLSKQAHEGGELEPTGCPNCYDDYHGWSSGRCPECMPSGNIDDFEPQEDDPCNGDCLRSRAPDDPRGPDPNVPLSFENRTTPGCPECGACKGSGTCHMCFGNGTIWFDPKMNKQAHHGGELRSIPCVDCHRDEDGGSDGQCNNCQPTYEGWEPRNDDPCYGNCLGLRDISDPRGPGSNEYDWDESTRSRIVDGKMHSGCPECLNCKGTGDCQTCGGYSYVWYDPNLRKKAQTWTQSVDPPMPEQQPRMHKDPWPDAADSGQLQTRPPKGMKRVYPPRAFPGNKPFADHPNNSPEEAMTMQRVVGSKPTRDELWAHMDDEHDAGDAFQDDPDMDLDSLPADELADLHTLAHGEPDLWDHIHDDDPRLGAGWDLKTWNRTSSQKGFNIHKHLMDHGWWDKEDLVRVVLDADGPIDVDQMLAGQHRYQHASEQDELDTGADLDDGGPIHYHKDESGWDVEPITRQRDDPRGHKWKQGHVGDDGLAHHFPNLVDCPDCGGRGNGGSDAYDGACRTCQGIGAVLKCLKCNGQGTGPHKNPNTNKYDPETGNWSIPAHDLYDPETGREDYPNPRFPHSCCSCTDCWFSDHQGYVPLGRADLGMGNRSWASTHEQIGYRRPGEKGMYHRPVERPYADDPRGKDIPVTYPKKAAGEPTDVCKHCGKPIRQYYVSNDWLHTPGYPNIQDGPTYFCASTYKADDPRSPRGLEFFATPKNERTAQLIEDDDPRGNYWYRHLEKAHGIKPRRDLPFEDSAVKHLSIWHDDIGAADLEDWQYYEVTPEQAAAMSEEHAIEVHRKLHGLICSNCGHHELDHNKTADDPRSDSGQNCENCAKFGAVCSGWNPRIQKTSHEEGPPKEHEVPLDQAIRDMKVHVRNEHPRMFQDHGYPEDYDWSGETPEEISMLHEHAHKDASPYEKLDDPRAKHMYRFPHPKHDHGPEEDIRHPNNVGSRVLHEHHWMIHMNPHDTDGFMAHEPQLEDAIDEAVDWHSEHKPGYVLDRKELEEELGPHRSEDDPRGPGELDNLEEWGEVAYSGQGIPYNGSDIQARPLTNSEKKKYAGQAPGEAPPCFVCKGTGDEDDGLEECSPCDGTGYRPHPFSMQGPWDHVPAKVNVEMDPRRPAVVPDPESVKDKCRACGYDRDHPWLHQTTKSGSREPHDFWYVGEDDDPRYDPVQSGNYDYDMMSNYLSRLPYHLRVMHDTDSSVMDWQAQDDKHLSDHSRWDRQRDASVRTLDDPRGPDVRECKWCDNPIVQTHTTSDRWAHVDMREPEPERYLHAYRSFCLDDKGVWMRREDRGGHKYDPRYNTQALAYAEPKPVPTSV